MNRAQRRKQAKRKKSLPMHKRMTRDQKLDALLKNGITAEDLDREYHAGYNNGFQAASPSVIKTTYAAFVLVLDEMLHYDREKIKEIMEAVDKHVVGSLTSEEIIDEVYERIGLQLDFTNPFDLIQERDD